MLVLIKVMGVKRTAAFCGIIVVVGTAVGMIYGNTHGAGSNLAAYAGGIP